MRLNYEKPSLSRLAQELRRRLVWSISSMEGNFAFGVPELNVCRREAIHLELAQSDECFQHGFLYHNRLDLFGLAIKLRQAREDIMIFSPSISLRTSAELIAATADMERNLAEIDGLLRDEDRYWASRLCRAANQTQLLTVNMALNQNYCDLLRLFLAGYQEAASDTMLAELDPEFLSTRAERAVQYAYSNIAMAEDFTRQYSHLQLYDLDVAVCLYHAAQIVAFVTGPQGTPQAIIQVNQCLHFFKVFYPLSKTAQPMVRDLERLARKLYSNPTRPHLNDRIETDTHDPSELAVAGSTVPKLSIHSLLRQADFPDADHHETSPQTENTVEDEVITGVDEENDPDFSFDPWMGWQGSLDPFGYLQLSDLY
ncbi:uncharacterized protein HMPREF1541_08458 [Cyphellophora europaea CBS 101466]|uniref:Transcription factor domain-containing protein n=1 Tax=Cyphellophora europaea (strain CBS 101466) TaxID=1220924 RepID=W2RI66_CYPE1|nr:uncharacterized protein HMPREF1541_08458 [Cyphellophora europaea CBS 101466]ETN36181.1 hypothetical protein HMPREF1541_08458 [Cyphellophora europaea CBS 101466]